MKSFRTAAAKTVEELEPTPFTIEGDWGREDFTATQPPEGALMLFAAYTVDSVGGQAQLHELMKLYEVVLGEDFPRFRELLENGQLDAATAVQIFSWLMEEWTLFPTQPASDSPTSRRPTGARSTGRVRSGASTP